MQRNNGGQFNALDEKNVKNENKKKNEGKGNNDHVGISNIHSFQVCYTSNTFSINKLCFQFIETKL